MAGEQYSIPSGKNEEDDRGEHGTLQPEPYMRKPVSRRKNWQSSENGRFSAEEEEETIEETSTFKQQMIGFCMYVTFSKTAITN